MCDDSANFRGGTNINAAVTVLRQMNPSSYHDTFFFKILSDVLPSTPRFLKWFVSCSFRIKLLYAFLISPILSLGDSISNH
jgi:hypothetical protein